MAGSRVDLSSDCDWIRGVRRRLSPNQDHRPDDATIDLIVIHAISLPPGEFCTAYVEALFCNQLNAGDHPYFAGIAELRVSAHLLIDRVGVMTQFVAFSRRAWHAGVSRHGGRERCNDFSIGIELEGTDEQPYTGEQYDRLGCVLRSLMKTWPAITSERVVGHCDVAPGRKTDPGPHFNWERVLLSTENQGENQGENRDENRGENRGGATRENRET